MRSACGGLLLAALLPAPAVADGREQDVAKSLKNCGPATYEQALDCLDRFLPAEDQAALAAPDGTTKAHFGLGMFIRNNWGLWSEAPLYRAMQAKGFRHPDDMSGAILEGFAARERGEEYRPTPSDPVQAQAEWDQAIREGRAGSCPIPFDVTDKDFEAKFHAAMKSCTATLEQSPKDDQD